MIGDNKMKKILKNNSGTSLLEMVFSIAMFAVIMLIVLSIFQSITEGQRNAVASQNIQESMRFAFEIMSKEIRAAKKSEDECEPAGSTAINKIFNNKAGNNSGPDLYFKNKNSECVYYYLNGGQLIIDRDGAALPVTPGTVAVSDLEFEIVDDEIGEFHSVQPRVTIKLKVKALNARTIHEQEAVIQTTISGRYYE